jgi:predicted RNA-binding Zn-ribbon protein involved in translation (DUF1610 family)
MVKDAENIRAATVHAVFDFAFETDFKEIMGATFNLLKNFAPDVPEAQIQSETLNFLMKEDVPKRQKWVKESIDLILEGLEAGAEVTFENQLKLKVASGKWHGEKISDLFSEMTVSIFPYEGQKLTLLTGSLDKIKKTTVPKLLAHFFTVLSSFDFNAIVRCQECGKILFDERGYKRRFCCKQCGDRFAARKSRARSKTKRG